MTAIEVAMLPDRAVVSVAGADAKAFLDNLITNDMDGVASDQAIFTGLLSPQGKILFDFFVIQADDGYLLDIALDQAEALVKRLSMYKLRAKVAISNVSEGLAVAAQWPRPAPVSTSDVAHFADPRHPALGLRSIVRGSIEANSTPHDYDAHRIDLGVPEGGKDYLFGEAFPHEALFDVLGGVSFTKGCYVGQEIVARMEHRGTARKRIVRVATQGASLPPAGSDILAGDVAIGTMGSSAGANGLGLLRLDRVAEFAAQGVGLMSGGSAILADAGDVARLAPKHPAPQVPG